MYQAPKENADLTLISLIVQEVTRGADVQDVEEIVNQLQLDSSKELIRQFRAGSAYAEDQAGVLGLERWAKSLLKAG